MTKELKIMTCGSVDDGKSTLLGNLLLATNNIHQDTLQTLDFETRRFILITRWLVR